MICKKCGAEFDGAFCPKCGERAEEKLTVCPVCGKERAEGENFCAKCGYAFEQKTSEPQKTVSKPVFDKAALIGGLKKYYVLALNVGKVFFSLLLFLILASPIMLHEGINTAGSGYTNAFNLYVDGRFTAVCALLAIIAFYSLIYAVFRCVRYFVFHNGKEGKTDRIAYFALNLAVFVLCCVGCSGAGDWFADAGAGLSFGIFVGIVGMALSVLRYLFEDKFVNSDGAQSVEVSDDVKAVEKKATKGVGLGTVVVTGVLVIAVVITSIVQGVYTNPFSSASYGFAETRADVVKQFGMPENAKEDSSSYTYYSTEYAAAERMIDVLTEAQEKDLSDGFDMDADSFDEDDLESMFDGAMGIDGIIEKLEEKQDNIKYKKSVVTFNNDGGENRNNDTVKSYVCEVVTPEVEGEEKTERKLKKFKVVEGYYISEDNSTKFTYVAKYDDGSFTGGTLNLGEAAFDKDDEIFAFSDVLGDYSVSVDKLDRISFQEGNAVIGDTLYISEDADTKIVTLSKADKEDITKVVILNGVEYIKSDDAFADFPNITEIVVPASLKYLNTSGIQNTAYYQDPSNWEDGTVLYVDNFLAEVKGEVGEEYTVREGTTGINERVFAKVNTLKSITIPASVTSIGDEAFKNCLITAANVPAQAIAYIPKNKLQTVVINSGEKIDDYAFENCGRLMSVGIPDSVTSIGKRAFYECSSLISITIPDSVTSIGDYAFRGCSSLESVTFGENSKLESIGDYAFEGCSSLTSITIPDSVTSIGDGAFYGCSLLTSITIPSSVTSIGDVAFEGCSSLEAVYLTDIEAWCNISFGRYSSNPMRYAHNLYLNGELVTELILPDSVTSIGEDAFYNCSSLTSITIPSSVTSIGSYAFAYCSSLTSITIPSSVTSIGSYAFAYCSSLTSITIPDSITSIGDEAFYGCSSLTSITIPSSVTSIGSYAFAYCSSLTSVTFGKNSKLNSIGDDAFCNCSSLTSITIPDSVTSIGSYAFAYCSSLTSVTFGENSKLNSIGYRVFYDCSSLTSITIPSSVTSIDEDAFYNCSSLTSVTFGENSELKSIGDSFYNCSSLTSITIPDSVTSIGKSTFFNCSSLTSVTFGKNSKLNSIGDNAFAYCSSLTSITIPDSVTSIGEDAFRGCSLLTSITIPDSVTSMDYGAFYYCSSLESVIFENTQGWWRSLSSYATSGTSISSSDLADPATAAKYLTDTYYDYYWKRG